MRPQLGQQAAFGTPPILSLPDSVLLQTLQTFVEYWSSRTISARSGPMRERYATIAIQVSETRSLKVNRFQIGKIQIEAAIETAVKCKPSVWSETMSPLKRALRLALSLRLNDLAVKAAEAMVALAEKCWSNEVRDGFYPEHGGPKGCARQRCGQTPNRRCFARAGN